MGRTAIAVSAWRSFIALAALLLLLPPDCVQHGSNKFTFSSSPSQLATTGGGTRCAIRFLAAASAARQGTEDDDSSATEPNHHSDELEQLLSSARRLQQATAPRPARSRTVISRPPPQSPSPSPQPAQQPKPSPSSKPSPAGGNGPAAGPAPRPNFVIILTDDQDLLLNSTHPAHMPLLHRHLAGPGLALRNFGVSTPTCCPSRLSLLTSKFVHNHNITANYLPYGGYGRFGQLMAPPASGTSAGAAAAVAAARGGLDAGWLPSQLQAAGYNTYLVGKFLNEFTPDGAPSCPRGWTALDALVDPWVYAFFGPVFSRNCDPRLQRYGPDDYSTDVIRDKGLGYIREAVAARRPFFLELAPIAPHEACSQGESGQWCGDPLPAPRHAGLFPDATIPSTPSWLTPFADTALTAKLQPPQRDANGAVLGPYVPPGVRRLTQRHRARLQSLQAVDEMVRDVVLELEAQGVLDNTYIIYMSDNGYHMGQHNANAGKYMPWEEDIRVPFFMRGPGVPSGVVSDYPAAVVDVAATLVNLAGLPLPADWDGYPLPLHRLTPPGAPGLDPRPWQWEPSAAAAASGYFREAVPIEMWVFQPGNSCHKLNYRSVRVCSNYLAFGSAAHYQQAMADAVSSAGRTSSRGAPAGSTLGLGTLLFGAAGAAAAGDTLGTSLAPLLLRAQQQGQGQQGQGQQPVVGTCYKYNIWCWGPRELYDIGLDPYETRNRFSDPQAQRLVGRLDALLNVMGYCRGARCREAYGAILAAAAGGSSSSGSGSSSSSASSNVAGGKMVVANFSDLMDPKYDALFAKLPRFAFKRCSPALIPAVNEAAWYRGE